MTKQAVGNKRKLGLKSIGPRFLEFTLLPIELQLVLNVGFQRTQAQVMKVTPCTSCVEKRRKASKGRTQVTSHSLRIHFAMIRWSNFHWNNMTFQGTNRIRVAH